MVGGGNTAVASCAPIFRALAPGIGSASRTDPLSWESSSEHGWLHCGGPGAGHFVKMVHNGVEYGMMQAYAEGFNILHEANAGSKYVKEETLRSRLWTTLSPIAMTLTLLRWAELWRRGSVVGSWLLDLTANVLRSDHELANSMGELATLVRVVGLSTLLWILAYPLLSLALHYLRGSTLED